VKGAHSELSRRTSAIGATLGTSPTEFDLASVPSLDFGPEPQAWSTATEATGLSAAADIRFVTKAELYKLVDELPDGAVEGAGVLPRGIIKGRSTQTKLGSGRAAQVQVASSL
jgi:hypothetical protein